MITRHEAYPELSKALQVNPLLFKREDLHPYGSHKGRSIPVMIDKYLEEGIKSFAVSSSGNAALAAAFHASKLNSKRTDKINLEILVGQRISRKKLAKLEQFRNQYIKVTMHDRPLQTLFNIIKDPQVRGLRQSTDDASLLGYRELAKELEEIKNLEAVFIGTSSGTTAQALLQNFTKKVEVHIVQTSSCHTMSDDFIDYEITDEQSIADAIVDQGSIRKNILIPLVKESRGTGWIASNEQIRDAQALVKNHTGLDISTNSALSVAGLMQAVYTGKTWNGSVVCMICGD